MDGSRPDAYWRVSRIFDEAVQLPPKERAAHVATACAGDHDLAAAVDRLLRAHARAGGFLETPAAELAAPLLIDDGGVPSPPEQLGPFRLLRRIGHGGMGDVWLAERADGQFRQVVALKVIRGGFLGEHLVRRFLRERQILASLEDPRIARLVNGGVTDTGLPWFAMEYVEGEPIDAHCRRLEHPLTARLSLFRDVCTAVRHAHDRGVVHRDLKAANILVRADGGVKLLDFGVAGLLEPDGDEPDTATTAVRALTPEYAAPEQFRGAPPTPSSDVYSLGVLLHELATGTRPFRLGGLSPGEAERVICTSDPPTPAGVPRDLAAIILKALAREPERRYASVAALTDDIDRFAAGRPVLARAPSPWYRGRRFVARHRVSVAAAATAAVVTLMGTAAYTALRPGHLPAGDATTVGVFGPGSDPDRVLVADFSTTLGDSVLVRAVENAMRIDLAQKPGLRVLSPVQVAGSLRRMNRAGQVVDDSVALELAAREGVKAIVLGDIAWIGGRYAVSARLITTSTGEQLAAARESADSAGLLDAVGRLTHRLRADLGESLASIRSSPPLSRVTTASLPALRAYSEAMRVYEEAGDRETALALLEQAVALDTGFASAYRMMGALHTALGDPGRATAALAMAYAHRDRLTPRERYLTMGSYHRNVTGDLGAAAAAYRAQLQREPDDISALNNLALVHADHRENAEAEQLFRRVLAIDSLLPSVHFGLAQALMHQGRFDEAARVQDDAGRRFPDNPVLPVARAELAAARGDWTRLEREALLRLERGHAANRPLDVLDAHQALGQVLILQGRLEEAERELRVAIALSDSLRADRRLLFNTAQLAWLELRHRQRPERARALMDSLITRRPVRDVAHADRPYIEVAGILGALGDRAGVAALLHRLVADSAASGARAGAAGLALDGYLALLDGRPRDAVRAFAAADTELRCPVCLLPPLAMAQEAAGDEAAAARTWERYLSTPWMRRHETDVAWLHHARNRLAELRRSDGPSP